MDSKLLKIINHYGARNQQRKLEEEVFELQEAITAHELKRSVEYEIPLTEIIGTEQNVAEELADVFVLLMQFKEYYHIDGNIILDIAEKKVNRQLKRMEKE